MSMGHLYVFLGEVSIQILCTFFNWGGRDVGWGWERERERGREPQCERETSIDCLLTPVTMVDQTCNLGMCPDQESNLWYSNQLSHWAGGNANSLLKPTLIKISDCFLMLLFQTPYNNLHFIYFYILLPSNMLYH